MAESRITKPITYSLRDRGRALTGQDRSNVDISSIVNAINSPSVQELVATKSLMGFYGHEIRQRFGTWPPDQALCNGQLIQLDPAVRTVSLTASTDGTITHRQEFLTTDAGEVAYRQYKAGVGGFSVAGDYKPINGKYYLSDFAGFDYVRIPNYVENTSCGLFDGLQGVQKDLYYQQLEGQIVALYDSASQIRQLFDSNDQCLDEIARLEAEKKRDLERKLAYQQRQEARQQELYDSFLCPTRRFDPQKAIFMGDSIANPDQSAEGAQRGEFTGNVKQWVESRK